MNDDLWHGNGVQREWHQKLGISGTDTIDSEVLSFQTRRDVFGNLAR